MDETASIRTIVEQEREKFSCGSCGQTRLTPHVMLSRCCHCQNDMYVCIPCADLGRYDECASCFNKRRQP